MAENIIKCYREPLNTALSDGKWCYCFENNMAFIHKKKHKDVIWYSILLLATNKMFLLKIFLLKSYKWIAIQHYS